MHYFVSILVCNHLEEERKLVALLLSYRCIVTISVLWLFLTVPWVGLQYAIVVFSDHTHLLFTCTRDENFVPAGSDYMSHSICVISATVVE